MGVNSHICISFAVAEGFFFITMQIYLLDEQLPYLVTLPTALTLNVD